MGSSQKLYEIDRIKHSAKKKKKAEIEWMMQHILLTFVCSRPVVILSVGQVEINGYNNNNINYDIQKNTKCRFCGDRDEMFNCIVSKRSKLAQKEYKT